MRRVALSQVALRSGEVEPEHSAASELDELRRHHERIEKFAAIGAVAGLVGALAGLLWAISATRRRRG